MYRMKIELKSVHYNFSLCSWCRVVECLMATTNYSESVSQILDVMSTTNILSAPDLTGIPNQLLHDQPVFAPQIQGDDGGSLTLQGGNSLGSLFLSTVDELLSHEKPCQDFTPPTQNLPKSVKHKSKNNAQKKEDKPSSSLVSNNASVVSQSTVFKPGPPKSQQSRPSQNAVFNLPARPHSNTSVLSTSESYLGPHSNASGDGSMYSSNFAQPSPAGSGDSNFAPRTPLSNNPLTPQSGHQPMTPQSGHLLPGQQSVSNPGTPIQQVQPARPSHLESEFISGLGSSTLPPEILDDQSHLQYLNTSTSARHTSLAKAPSDTSLLADLPASMKPEFEQEGFLTSKPLHAAEIVSSSSATIGWQQSYPQFSVSHPQHILHSGTSLSQVAAPYTQAPTHLEPKAAQSISNTGVLGVSGGTSSMFSDNNAQMAIIEQQGLLPQGGHVRSESLNVVQSQILENLSEWSKPGSKAGLVTSSGLTSEKTVAEFNVAQSGSALFSDRRQPTTTAFRASPSQQSKNNTVLSMLDTAESGVKQHFSSAYEAISPVSDYSPSGDQQKRIDEDHSSLGLLAGHGQQRATTTPVGQPSATSGGASSKSKVGPLARRRSASAERRNAPSTTPTSKEKPVADFSFDDEFGFDQNEPTIKLPSQLSTGGSRKHAAPPPAEPVVNPMLSTMNRDVYTDKSIYDSVQELVALQQKQKWLTEVLGSRNKTPSGMQKSRSVAPVADVGSSAQPGGHAKVARTSSKKKTPLAAAAPSPVTSVHSKNASASRHVEPSHSTATPGFTKQAEDSFRRQGSRGVAQQKPHTTTALLGTTASSIKSHKQNSSGSLAMAQLPPSFDRRADLSADASTDLLTNFEVFLNNPPSAATSRAQTFESTRNKSSVEHHFPSGYQQKDFSSTSVSKDPISTAVSAPVVESSAPVSGVQSFLPPVTSVSVDAFFATPTMRETHVPPVVASKVTNVQSGRSGATSVEGNSRKEHHIRHLNSTSTATGLDIPSHAMGSFMPKFEEQLRLHQEPPPRHFTTTSPKKQPNSLASQLPSQKQIPPTEKPRDKAIGDEHLSFLSQDHHPFPDAQQPLPLTTASVDKLFNASSVSSAYSLPLFSTGKKVDLSYFREKEQPLPTCTAPPVRAAQRSHQAHSPLSVPRSKETEPTQRSVPIATTSHSRPTTPHVETNRLQERFLTSHSSLSQKSIPSSAALSSSALVTQPQYSTVLSSAPNTIMYTAAPLPSRPQPSADVVHKPPLLPAPARLPPPGDNSSRFDPSSLFPYSTSAVSLPPAHSHSLSNAQQIFAQILADSQSSPDLRALEAYASLSGQSFANPLNPFSLRAPVVPGLAPASASMEINRHATDLRSAPSTSSSAAAATTPSVSQDRTGLLPTYEQSVDQQTKKSLSPQVDFAAPAHLLPHAALSPTGAYYLNYVNQAFASERRLSRDASQSKDAERAVSPKPATRADTQATGKASLFSTFSPAGFSHSVTVSSASTHAVSVSSSTATELLPSAKAGKDTRAPAAISILKDKTYHGPKKKHILEKYSQQHQTPVQATVLKRGDVTTEPAAKTALGCTSTASAVTKSVPGVSGLPHSASGKSAPGTNSTPMSTVTGPRISGSPSKTNGALSANTPVVSSTGDVTSISCTSVTSMKSTAPRNASPATSKTNTPIESEEKASFMFSIFDTLLQEASESAAGSLKDSQAGKDKNPAASAGTSTTTGLTSVAATAPSVNDTYTTSSAPSKTTVAVTKANVTSSKASTLPSKASVSSRKAATSASKTVSASSKISPGSSNTGSKSAPTKTSDPKKSRSPATLPLKRRYVPAYHGKPEAPSTSTAPKAVVPLEPTDKTASPAVSSSASPAASAATAESSILPTPPPAGDSVPVVSAAAAEFTASEASPKPSGLKLRITAFRSAAGEVIHHASMLGTVASDGDEDSDHSHKKKKHKKLKKKKRKRRSSVSDSDVSQEPKLPVVLPTSSLTQPATQSDPVQKDKKESDDTPQPSLGLPGEDSAADSVSLVAGKKRGRKPAAKKQVPPSKKAKSLLAAVKPAESEKPAKKSAPPAKKRAPRATIRMRYKPNISVASDAGSEVTPTAPIVLNRVPGRTPMYLQASASQGTSGDNAGSVPTIQLVPRSVAKATNPKTSVVAVVSSSPSAATALSVKLSVPVSKPPQTQVATKTTHAGVRYLLQSPPSGGAVALPQRVIVPKLPVGKAAVITVSSSGARVTPAVQPSNHSQPQRIVNGVLTSQTLAMKRLPINLLSKVAVPTSPIVVASASVLCSKSSVTNSVANPVVSHSESPTKTTAARSKPALTPTSTTDAVKLPPTNQPTYAAISTPTIRETNTSVKSVCQSKNISDSQFQTAFSNLISSPNPLGKYIPPSLPPCFSSLGITLDTSRCSECGDAFLLRPSLRHHYERRSILVKVRCVQCSQMLVFFNKCEILRHAREHSERGDVMQFNGAQLSPIPLSLCKPRTKDYFLRLAEDRNHSEVSSLSSGALVCSECQFMGDHHCSLDEHFQRKAVEGGKTCDICKLYLVNNCAFSAHMRMHRHLAPHTCPECGVLFEEHAMEFNLHLRMQCFHLSRVSCFKCKLCNLTFMTNDQLRNHLRLNHVQLFYKCRECPMAFKTTQNIANHQRTAHNLTPEPTNTLKTIHKCPLCDTVFTDSSHSQQLFVLHKHFDTHINSTRITAYKCYVCGNIFEQKAVLREHLREKHDMSSTTELIDDAAFSAAETVLEERHGDERKRPLIDAKRQSKPAKRIKSDQIRASLMNQLSSRKANNSLSTTNASLRQHDDGNSDDSESSADTKKKHRRPFKIRIKAFFPENKASSQQVSPPEDVASACVNTEGKRTYTCPECNKVFVSTHSRSSHVRIVHRGIRVMYCCPHCPRERVKFAKKITLVKHLAKDHQIVSPQKEDVKIIRSHSPNPSPTSKLKALGADLSASKSLPRRTSDQTEERRFPRKKITTRNPVRARARRLAAASQQRLKTARRHAVRRHPSSNNDDESDESYGEVDEKTVEEGWNVPDVMDAENSDFEGEIDVSSLHLPSVYTCVKCDFQHEDRLTFQDHIVEHSQSVESVSSGTAAVLTMVQCTECGLCFASTASLDKHLYIKHKIRHRKVLERYDARLREERAKSGQSHSAASGTGSCIVPKLHRCKVCFRKFDTDTELRTHMRTHGLAFVRSKTS